MGFARVLAAALLAAPLAWAGAAGPGAAQAGAGTDATAEAEAPPAAQPEAALTAPPSAPATAPTRGPVTNLPLPRYVSLKAAEGNARRGPGLTHRIDWVYKRRNLPLQVVGEYGHWRQVIDRDGAGGWVHYALLSGVRTVLIERHMAELRRRPEPGARVLARAEAGVIARLGACTAGWCEIEADSHEGWVEKSALWGVAPGELRE